MGRKDGCKRPDRYKRIKYQNDEDLQRNKYITKGAKRRLIEEKERKMFIHDNISNAIDDIFANPPKQIVSALNEFYNGNEVLFKQKITKSVIKHVDISNVYVSKTEMIKFIQQLLCDKVRQRDDGYINKQGMCKGLTVRGRGNVSYGTGVMLSECIETKRKKAIENEKSQPINQPMTNLQIQKA